MGLTVRSCTQDETVLSDCGDSAIVKSVSTIPDECKGVGLEISTSSKRKAIER